eukprot:1153316-Pelagomonas_calceolata.AAC.6
MLRQHHPDHHPQALWPAEDGAAPKETLGACMGCKQRHRPGAEKGSGEFRLPGHTYQTDDEGELRQLSDGMGHTDIC